MRTEFPDRMRLQLCLTLSVASKDEACRLGQYDARPIFDQTARAHLLVD